MRTFCRPPGAKDSAYSRLCRYRGLYTLMVCLGWPQSQHLSRGASSEAMKHHHYQHLPAMAGLPNVNVLRGARLHLQKKSTRHSSPSLFASLTSLLDLMYLQVSCCTSGQARGGCLWHHQALSPDGGLQGSQKPTRSAGMRNLMSWSPCPFDPSGEDVRHSFNTYVSR